MLAGLDQLDGESSLLDLDKDQDSDALTYHAAYLLAHLPPEIVFEHYGEEGLFFVACNAPHREAETQFKGALAEMAGYNPDFIQKAKLWAWQKHSTSQSREVLAQYAVMEHVAGDALNQVDLPAILRGSVLPGVTVGDKRLGDYALLPLCSEESFSEPAGWDSTWSHDIMPADDAPDSTPITRYSMWLDAPTGFALAYKGRPQAMVTVACLEQNKLIICQLQGVRAKLVDPHNKYSDDGVVGSVHARGLAPFDWQKSMVGVAVELAAGMGLEELVIQGGENNVWRHKRLKGETEPHITAETAARAYDLPAKRLGFVRQDDGNWHWTLVKNTPEN
jgi:hypothetical protein